MQKIDYLIVGGGVAGTTAAEVLRQNDKTGSIAIVSDEPHIFYSRIMLSKPNFFLEKIPFEKIWLKTEQWYKDANVQFIGGRKAAALNAKEKTVTLDNGDVLQYGKLLAAVGGYPRPWTVPGADKKGVFYLRSLDDARGVIGSIKNVEQALSIGGGFISFEMCDMMRLAGLDVTLILRESYYWEPLLDETSGKMIEEALVKGGVKIKYKTEVREVLGSEHVEGAILNDGTKIDCQMIIAGLGLVLPLDWLKAGGVEINRGIMANEYLETNISDIWTAGDSAEFNDLILNEKIQLGNWINAQMQGRAAANNMLASSGTPGFDKKPFKLVSFYTTQGFGISVAMVGDSRASGPGRSVIARGSKESGSYARIIIVNGEVTGATLINRTSDMAPISKLIEKDFKSAGHEKELGDPNFDLKNLLK